MKKVIFGLATILLLLIVVMGCSARTFSGTYSDYEKYQLEAKEICSDRNGELILFGVLVNPISEVVTYESVCFKQDEQHFYYDLIKVIKI